MYTHLITFERCVESLGGIWCEGKFRTTADAVELHRKTLAERCATGEVRNVYITPIAKGSVYA